jgi:hypothetical protein
MSKPYPPTPELDKLKAIAGKSRAVGEFVDWMQEKHKAFFATEHQHTDACGFVSRYDRGELCGARSGDLFRLQTRLQKLLAEFFEIDEDKCERERRAILDSLQDCRK